MGFAYQWSYRVKDDTVESFLEAYRPGGLWTRLFRKAEGYLKTELLQDRADPLCFATIDYWVSERAWQQFRETFAAEFEALDEACEQLTTDEREIGRYRFEDDPEVAAEASFAPES